MKALRTTDTNTTLTLPGAGTDRDLPAQRVLAFDPELGETQHDARAAWITTWMPDEAEAQRLDAGAAIEIVIHGPAHPPISVAVTDAVIPERELIDRGHVDRALGYLYATLSEHLTNGIHGDEHGCANALPDAPAFADLWTEAVTATRTDRTDATTMWTPEPHSPEGPEIPR